LPLAGIALTAGSKAWSILHPSSALATHLASWQVAMVGPALIALAAGLTIAAARGSSAALVGVILLAAADQGYYGLSYVWKSPREDVWAVPNLSRLPNTPAERVLVPGSSFQTVYGLANASGAAAMPPL